MIEPRIILALATGLGAVGLGLVLPGGSGRRRAAGALFALAALVAWASLLPGVGPWLANGLFALLAAVTIVAAGAMISCRSPMYSAIWFGMTLLGTAGLFLLVGAEFLAVATLVVYAGAILVTFLFVLMLSEPEGRTSYDRRSWAAMLSATTGAVLIGVLSLTLATGLAGPAGPRASGGGLPRDGLPSAPPTEPADAVGGLLAPSPPAAHRPPPEGPYAVAQLGTELFTRYVIPVEAVATLLLAALVGAAVIIGPRRTPQAP
ncbi:MAG: NADH-quinone oxidoreductase subunit J [Thermoguttaceae bacterium]|jgi:NADH-quinone oxidoreductase subunit J